MNYAFGALAPDDQPIYSIGAVERMVDIPAATIRNWEQRYGLIAPERSQGGHRLYARRQVEQLRFVKRELDAGLQPAEAHRLLAEHDRSGSAAGPRRSGRGTAGPDPAGRAGPVRRRVRRVLPSHRGLRGRSSPSTRPRPSAPPSERRPDLVVVELMISGGTGAELCRRLEGAGGALVPGHLRTAAQDDALAGRRGRVPAEAARPAAVRLDREGPARDAARFCTNRPERRR